MQENNVVSLESTVTMNFVMSIKDGAEVLSTYNEKPVRFTMGDGSFSEAFEEAMKGLSAGDKKKIVLAPNDAFGEVNPGNVHVIPRERFPQGVAVEEGVAIAFDHPSGHEMVGVVATFDDATVTVDFNHPLSGQTLVFDVEVLSVGKQEPHTHTGNCCH